MHSTYRQYVCEINAQMNERVKPMHDITCNIKTQIIVYEKAQRLICVVNTHMDMHHKHTQPMI